MSFLLLRYVSGVDESRDVVSTPNSTFLCKTNTEILGFRDVGSASQVSAWREFIHLPLRLSNTKHNLDGPTKSATRIMRKEQLWWRL